MRASVRFYKHQASTNLFERLVRMIHRLASPKFAHCTMVVYGVEFNYGRRGFRVACPASRFAEEVEIDLVRPNVLLLWDRDKQPFGCWLRIALSPLLPFRNCSSIIGDALGVNARTPDQLYERIKGDR